MKRFTLKFIIAIAFFFIPACYYQFLAIPSFSGDLGRLGMIPFGMVQEGLEVNGYHRDIDYNTRVVDVCNPDSLRLFEVITIGDSFSQQTKNGYQQSLSKCLGSDVANFRGSLGSNILGCYLFLLNKGYVGAGSTVILEIVERSFVRGFCNMKPLEPRILESCNKPVTNKKTRKDPFLNSFFSWIRLSCGYKSPVVSFTLTKDCFTHDKYSSTLHVLNSPTVDDGDLLWKSISAEEYEKASGNIREIIEISEAKGINLIIMIACDKYDAYEPWIKGAHEMNPTLDRISDERRLYVSRDCLREAISGGVKDVYKLNDTHWSVVGADIVGNDLYGWMVRSGLYPASIPMKQEAQ